MQIKKNNGNGIYYGSFPAKPGEVVEIDSDDYSYLDIRGIKGTKDNPIIFVNNGLVTIGKKNPIHYCMRLYGEHFKVIAKDVDGGKGIVCGNESKVIGLGVHLANSTNYEISGLEVENVEVGFFSNPTSGRIMEDCIFRNNYIHDLPATAATGPEAFYLGSTSGKVSCVFKNCIIEDNVIDGTDGDGIQVCNGTFLIRRNVIKNFARISRSSHRNAIISGTNCTSQIIGNTINGGYGVALNILGGGGMEVSGNEISNVDLKNLNEDLIYISGRDGKLVLDFHGNTFKNNVRFRKAIGNYSTVNYSGSKFYENTGITKSQCTLRPGDTWGESVKTFKNEEQSKEFTRSNCSMFYEGTKVTYKVPAGLYESKISQADANEMALRDIEVNGQAKADELGECKLIVVGQGTANGKPAVLYANKTWE